MIGIQSVRLNALYRYANFTLKTDCEDGFLLHNTLTGEVLFFDNQEDVENNRQLLIEKYYLVTNDFNDIETVEQLRNLLRLKNSNKGIFSYTILPTTCCNARCFYCFENGIKKYPMTKEVAEDSVQYILSHRHNMSVKLRWFGGEPLLGKNIIDYICNRLMDEDVPFYSTMLSNGYLFDDEVIKKAKSLWNLKSLQITLDGTEEVYNRIKAYVGIKDSAFNKVLDNIDKLLDNEIRIQVRLNMDSHNAEDLSNLIDMLGDRYKGKKGISVYVAKLFDDEDKKDAELKEIWYHKLVNKLRENKIGGYSRKLSKLKYSSCMADTYDHIIINPNGELAKCEHYCEEKLVGNIYSDEINQEMINYWKETEKGEICNTCPLQPSCIILKNCFNTEICDEYKRDKKIDTIKDTLLHYYEFWKHKKSEDNKN